MKKNLLTALIFLSFGNLYSQVDLNSGLMAHYPFSGDATDNSPNHNDGTVLGATLTTDRFGQANKAYYFDGNGAYIRVEADSTIEPDSFLSISIWVKPDDYSVRQSPLSKRLFHNADPYNSYVFTTNEVPGNVNQRWAFGISSGFSGSGLGVLDTAPFDTSGWTHLVGIYDGSYLKLYVNGGLVSQAAKTGKLGYTDSSLRIGLAIPGSSLQYFKGKIDDVRIYNRVLNEDEITELNTLGTTTSVTRVKSRPVINAYPNPAEGRILFSTDETVSHYKIFDLTGRKVKEGKPEDNQVSVNELVPGTYLLSLITADGSLSTIKIIKK